MIQPSDIVLDYSIIHISTMNRHVTEYWIVAFDIAPLRICHAGKQIQCIAIMSLVLDMKTILPTTVFQLGMKKISLNGAMISPPTISRREIGHQFSAKELRSTQFIP